MLLSGHHERIARWRRKQALRTTLLRRPDLLKKARLDEQDRKLLQEIEKELNREVNNGYHPRKN